MIISTVRSSQRFLLEDQKRGRGLLFESRRFNVAITRAKELLIIVGNGQLLAVSIHLTMWIAPALLITDHMRVNIFFARETHGGDRFLLCCTGETHIGDQRSRL